MLFLCLLLRILLCTPLIQFLQNPLILTSNPHFSASVKEVCMSITVLTSSMVKAEIIQHYIPSKLRREIFLRSANGMLPVST